MTLIDLFYDSQINNIVLHFGLFHYYNYSFNRHHGNVGKIAMWTHKVYFTYVVEYLLNSNPSSEDPEAEGQMGFTNPAFRQEEEEEVVEVHNENSNVILREAAADDMQEVDLNMIFQTLPATNSHTS